MTLKNVMPLNVEVNDMPDVPEQTPEVFRLLAELRQSFADVGLTCAISATRLTVSWTFGRDAAI